MTNEHDTQQARDLLDNFNRVDESVKDKLINGVKCLAFLYNLSDDNQPAPNIQPAI